MMMPFTSECYEMFFAYVGGKMGLDPLERSALLGPFLMWVTKMMFFDVTERHFVRALVSPKHDAGFTPTKRNYNQRKQGCVSVRLNI